MKVNHIFISINAANLAAQSDWWAKLIDRHFEQKPMPSCHEWNLTDDVLFQVLDSDEGHGGTTVTLHVPDLDQPALNRNRLSAEELIDSKLLEQLMCV